MKKNLLVITLNWPAPSFSAAGVRLFQLIDFFKKQGCQITIASTAEEPSQKDVSYEYEGVSKVKIRLNHDSFDDFIRELDPYIVLFDRFTAEEQFGWRVAEHASQAVRILDTEDLHSFRTGREEALKTNTDFSKEYWLKSDRTKREVTSIYRSDLSLIISEHEMHLLRPIVQGHEDILLHLPFMLEPLGQIQIDRWPSFDERSDFMFIGFGGHAPNIDAVVELKTKVWPLIRKQLPQAKLHIYGGNLPQHIYQMHNAKEGFLVEGWAKDVREVMARARMVLAPLRFGAGLKGKLIDAMQYGTPSVTTTVGAESMHGNLDWNGYIKDDPHRFAQAAVALYQDRQEWQAAQQHGVVIINTLYDKTVWYKELESKVGQIENNLSEHRTENFIGALLQYQTLASTKYMAKWIEAKNRYS